MYLNPPRPFIIWPEKLQWELGNAMDAIVVKEMAARIHIQTMGTGIDLITLGDLDFLLTLHTEDELFKPWIGEWVAKVIAITKATNYYRKWCRIAVFDVDMQTEKIKFLGWLSDGDKLRTVLETK
jgi:hypothetical protein